MPKRRTKYSTREVAYTIFTLLKHPLGLPEDVAGLSWGTERPNEVRVEMADGQQFVVKVVAGVG